jgi:hypothetical protein
MSRRRLSPYTVHRIFKSLQIDYSSFESALGKPAHEKERSTLLCSIKSFLYAFRFCPLSPDNSELFVEHISSMHSFAYNVLEVALQGSP